MNEIEPQQKKLRKTKILLFLAIWFLAALLLTVIFIKPLMTAQRFLFSGRLFIPEKAEQLHAMVDELSWDILHDPPVYREGFYKVRSAQEAQRVLANFDLFYQHEYDQSGSGFWFDAKMASKHKIKLSCWSMSGYIFLKQANYSAAAGVYDSMLILARQEHNKPARAMAHAGLGCTYLKAGQLDSATNNLERALQLSGGDDLNTLRCFVLIKLGEAYQPTVNKHRSATCYLEGAKLARSMNYLNTAHYGYDRAADSYMWDRNWSEAEAALHEALLMSRRLEDIHAQARHFLGLARTSFARENYQYCIGYADKAQEIFTELADTSGMMWGMLEKGRALRTRGNPKAAYPILDSALILARKLGDNQAQGILWLEIGVYYYSYKEYEMALGCFQKSVRFSRNAGDAHTRATALHDIGVTKAARGRYTESINYLTAALEIYDEMEIADESAELTERTLLKVQQLAKSPKLTSSEKVKIVLNVVDDTEKPADEQKVLGTLELEGTLESSPR